MASSIIFDANGKAYIYRYIILLNQEVTLNTVIGVTVTQGTGGDQITGSLVQALSGDVTEFTITTLDNNWAY